MAKIPMAFAKKRTSSRRKQGTPQVLFGYKTSREVKTPVHNYVGKNLNSGHDSEHFPE